MVSLRIGQNNDLDSHFLEPQLFQTKVFLCSLKTCFGDISGLGFFMGAFVTPKGEVGKLSSNPIIHRGIVLPLSIERLLQSLTVRAIMEFSSQLSRNATQKTHKQTQETKNVIHIVLHRLIFIISKTQI